MGNQVAAIIVDEFTSSPSQGEMARALVRTFLHSWRAAPTSIAADASLIMRSVHSDLRQKYRLSNATYGILLSHRHGRNASVLTAGDCRIGYSDLGIPRWRTQVHTKAQTMLCMGLQPVPGDGSVVTRCFKARRWMPPERWEIEQHESIVWTLATDGFGAPSAAKECSPKQYDDASCMTFSWSGYGAADTEDNNWLVLVD